MAKVVKASKPAKAGPVKRKGAKYKMPERIPEGEILTDVLKGQWTVGKSIGKGGFGEIYSASKIGGKGDYAIKIEPKENGPLFVEMHFFMRVCKENDINEWMKGKKLKFLGLPRYVANGSHEHNEKQYRFVIMERFGKSLEAVIEEHKGVISPATAFNIALQVLDALEYMHNKGYIHADVKASNLLFGYKKASEDKIHLVDFGLASKHSDEFKPDARFAHNGTIEFTSRDAHIGANTRRGDLEILAYNILRWCTSRLPWENKLSDCKYVHQEKDKYMKDVDELLQTCFGKHHVPEALRKFFKYVVNMGPLDTPDYEFCRKVFREGVSADVSGTETKKPKTPVKTPVKKPAVKEIKKPKRADITSDTALVDEQRELPKRAARGRSKMANGVANGVVPESDTEEDDSDDYSPRKPKQKKGIKRSSQDKKPGAIKKKKTGM